MTRLERLLAAQSPETPSDVLTALYREEAYGDTSLVRLLARNPNLPPDLLKILATQGFDLEVSENPALPLLLLEDPAFFETLDYHIRRLLSARLHLASSLYYAPVSSRAASYLHTYLLWLKNGEVLKINTSPVAGHPEVLCTESDFLSLPRHLYKITSAIGMTPKEVLALEIALWRLPATMLLDTSRYSTTLRLQSPRLAYFAGNALLWDEPNSIPDPTWQATEASSALYHMNLAIKELLRDETSSR